MAYGDGEEIDAFVYNQNIQRYAASIRRGTALLLADSLRFAQ